MNFIKLTSTIATVFWAIVAAIALPPIVVAIPFTIVWYHNWTKPSTLPPFHYPETEFHAASGRLMENLKSRPPILKEPEQKLPGVMPLPPYERDLQPSPSPETLYVTK